jgi:hypothetical protein
LLPGDDGDGAAIGEQRTSLARLRRRLTALLLSGDDPRDVFAAAIVALRAGNRVGPRRAVGRVAGEKRRDRRKVVRVVGREPADPREAPDVDRACGRTVRPSMGESPLCWRAPGNLLCQSAARTVKQRGCGIARRTLWSAAGRAPVIFKWFVNSVRCYDL